MQLLTAPCGEHLKVIVQDRRVVVEMGEKAWRGAEARVVEAACAAGEGEEGEGLVGGRMKFQGGSSFSSFRGWGHAQRRRNENLNSPRLLHPPARPGRRGVHPAGGPA
jgi:hypothetical protein